MIFYDLRPGMKIHHDEIGELKVTQVINDLFIHGTTREEYVFNYPVYFSTEHDAYFHGLVYVKNEDADQLSSYLLTHSADIFIKRLNAKHKDSEYFNTIQKKVNESEGLFIPVIDSGYKLDTFYIGLNLFLGKAGVGKSHLIKEFSDSSNYSIIKLAPTALAAINIGGTTIHSFFGLLPRLIDTNKDDFVKINKKFSEFDYLVIDEISMVPGYIIDAIDKILRVNNDPRSKFGGKVILGFGDLMQLEPIKINDANANKYIEDNYNGSYWFFDSKVISEDNPPICWPNNIIFPTIIDYSKRHNDKSFVKFLDIIRKGEFIDSDIDFFDTTCDEINQNLPNINTTYLTTKNDTAKRINNENLKQIRSNTYTFKAAISGEWNNSFPNDELINLRIGAKVLFIKNDMDKQFINGDSGEIIEINQHIITVEKSNGSVIEVGFSIWEKYKYIYNETTRVLETEVIGTFKQLPIKLGWAITIHKSQGMTLDHISLNLNDAFFAKGMFYVAISRVRNANDIYISEGKLNKRLLQKPDKRVIDFMDDIGVLNA